MSYDEKPKEEVHIGRPNNNSLILIPQSSSI